MPQIGSERLADLGFVSGDIETIVVNLIRRANLSSEILQCTSRLDIGSVQHRAQFSGCRKKRACFHLDDSEIVLDAEMQIEATLRLDDFSGTNFPGRAGNRAANVRIVKIR